MLRVLQRASQESEDVSEEIAQSFLQTSIPIDAFLRQYRDARKKYHMRNARYERLMSDQTTQKRT
jgi:hypothetical protein